MQSVKNFFLTILTALLVAILGWWAMTSLEPGDIHAERARYKALEQRNEELEKEVADLEEELAELQPPTLEPEEQGSTEVSPPPPAPSQYANLISEIQELVDDKVTMKAGSKGTRVGTVQEFLNIYFKTSKKIDNDFGKSMETDIRNFQKAEGLPVTGQASTQTFTKMVEWLRSH